MSEKILVLEDEIGIRSFVSINLKREGYEVIEAGTGQEAIDKISNEKNISIALLDVMLPDMSGIEVCKYIRTNFDSVGIIMLTAKSQEEDKIEGFISGADDYMVKPFSIKELLARSNSVLRRYNVNKNISKETILSVGNLKLDLQKHEVIKGSEKIDLTFKEFELLRLLLENKGKVLSRNYLLDKIWGYEYYGETRTVDVHIRYLRKKIEGSSEDEKYIETIRGIGYKID